MAKKIDRQAITRRAMQMYLAGQFRTLEEAFRHASLEASLPEGFDAIFKGQRHD